MLPVDQAIYKNRNIIPGSYYAKCVKQDLISNLQPVMRAAGYYLSYEGIYKRNNIAIATDTPWHHVKHLPTKKCGIDHNIKFNMFEFIPPRCLECWKVVVGPRTLKELFRLLDVEKGLNVAAKCGIELRWYTDRFYGGYFYTNSFDEGRDRYEQVRKAVDDHIGKDVPVILKRACTEYEMIKGASPAWVMTDAALDLDQRLECIIDMTTPTVTGQSDEAIAAVHTHWIEWAWKNQDRTVDEYIGGQPLYPPTVKYHEGGRNEIKKDLARAKAKVRHNIEPEVVNSIHAAMRGFSMTKKVTAAMIGTVMGYDAISPLYRGEHNDYL
jgi:hypothetical protein